MEEMQKTEITLQVGQDLLLGSHITIRVLRSREGVVRIGVKAPREILILRKEVRDRSVRNGPKDDSQHSGGLQTTP